MIASVYHGYMDESGTHDGSDVVAVVGYLSTHDAWIDFEAEWNRIMQHYAVKDFHMNQFEGRYGEFNWMNYWWWPWADNTRIRLIERITDICQRRTIIGLGCAVVREQYQSILTDKIQGDLRHPYYFCIYACLNMIINLESRWSTTSGRIEQQLNLIKPINLLFDQKKGRFRLGDRMISWEAQAQDFFQRVKSGLDPEGKVIGAMAFGDRRRYPQLRAADLIVYEAAKLARQLWKEPNRPVRKSMEALKKNYNLLITFPAGRQMRNFVKIVETGIDAMNSGATDEEMDQIAKQLRETMER